MRIIAALGRSGACSDRLRVSLALASSCPDPLQSVRSRAPSCSRKRSSARLPVPLGACETWAAAERVRLDLAEADVVTRALPLAARTALVGYRPTFGPEGLYFLGPVYEARWGLPDRTAAYDWLPSP